MYSGIKAKARRIDEDVHADFRVIFWLVYAICIQNPSHLRNIWHNDPPFRWLVIRMFREMSKVVFHTKSLDLCTRYINPVSRRKAKIWFVLGVDVFHSAETIKDQWKSRYLVDQPETLASSKFPGQRRGKFSDWRKWWRYPPISKCYHIEI